MSMAETARLLPWSTLDGNPCFLRGDGTGYLSRVADSIESVQLGMAGELLGHAADMLADDKATPDQLRFALARMSESLRNRGRRLVRFVVTISSNGNQGLLPNVRHARDDQ
ncbi:hypothetical protein ABZ352_38780 [Streptomyces griseofuscus]|nr:hypothetical protein [Streptomyces sp. CRPSP2-6A1]